LFKEEMSVTRVLLSVWLLFSCVAITCGQEILWKKISKTESADATAQTKPFQVLHINTMSIVARDPETGELGVAVESHYFSVGPVCPWAEAGVGAVATQAIADPAYGPLGLALMRAGKDAPTALKALLAGDAQAEIRQIAVIDAKGNVAAHTGSRPTPAAGHQMGRNYSVQANTMSSAKVWPAMAEAFEKTTGDLTDRLMAALEAGQKAGGDIRGQQTAAIIVVSGTPSGQPWKDRLFDLRVEDSPEPITELKRLVRLQRAYRLIAKGDEFAAQKKWDEAIKSYKEGVTLAPEKEELRYGLAATLFLSGGEEEALPIFRQVFQENPDWVEITKRNVITGDLPNDPARIQRILEQAPQNLQKKRTQ
jgi:uncharacterized Ntn-hydrolase superfamily protein